MMRLACNSESKDRLEILCLGSHSDDIEIGCGGSILRLLREFPKSVVHWVVFSATGVRKKEAENAASMFAGNAIPGGPALKDFQDGFLPFHGADVKALFEGLKPKIAPDLIFTHNRRDAHQDHRLVAELTWNTFRNHLILEYEIPKYDGDMGQPNVYIPLTAQDCQKKVDILLHCFESQRSKRWFEKETFTALMRLRGMESNAESGYAEAFYGHKLVL